MIRSDLYAKLKPPVPTPEDEVCKCVDAPPIKLMSALRFNPLHCINCNLEVSPEGLGMSEELIESIANWRQVHEALYMLWLDSGDYADWAKSQLLDLSGQVNRLGRQAQSKLHTIRKCYYWYFQDTGNPDREPMSTCPDCAQPLLEYNHGKFAGYWLTCESCLLVIQAA
jgi:predicted  nucleic acid-binding Zn ribbon protein